MRNALLTLGLAAAPIFLSAPVAQACGGLFCSTTPVDQSAERIVFTVHEDHTDMVVQITYQGDDEDFAWLVPLVEVPDPDSLETVPPGALAALDAATQPIFAMHPDCSAFSSTRDDRGVGCGGVAADSLSFNASGTTGVDVFFEQDVGPYTAVALGSEDAQATAAWLRDNGYNIAPAMDPYLELYTAEGMKFLALKLRADASVSDIQPFKLTLPGKTPGVPLRLTALAAEPEMGIKVWIFADQRSSPANAEEVEIDSRELRWQPGSFGGTNNYAALVAREVDAHDGRAWVVDMAADVEASRDAIFAQVATQEDDLALQRMVGNSLYMTRLYTRVSPEEMTYDPVFRRSERDDVDRTRELPYVPELCRGESEAPDPCHFATCGALGLCRAVEDPASKSMLAACACAPGTTARQLTGPNGNAQVSCQDQRLSFMNPGDRMTQDAAPLPDTCVNVDCGEHGHCVSMNLTPSCECDQGFVAAPSDVGTRCVRPEKSVPELFYSLRPPDRDADLPAGREVKLAKPSAKMDNAEIMRELADTEQIREAPADGGCTARRMAQSNAGWLLPLLGTLLLWRKRRLRVG